MNKIKQQKRGLLVVSAIISFIGVIIQIQAIDNEDYTVLAIPLFALIVFLCVFISIILRLYIGSKD